MQGLSGHAKRVMMAVWSYLRQFMYTKWVIVVDDDIDARDWKDVMWAVSTRMDPARDITLIENTPIDYLDFAAPESGLGSKIGLDATTKLPETKRDWGRKIRMDGRSTGRDVAAWACRVGQGDLEVGMRGQTQRRVASIPERRIVVRPARAEEAALLTDLSLRSKAVWGYDAAFLARCRAAMTVKVEAILTRPHYVAEVEGAVVGFYGFEPEADGIGLDYLFVAPEAIGGGVGRALWEQRLPPPRWGMRT
jgi:hypothetical protein